MLHHPADNSSDFCIIELIFSHILSSLEEEIIMYQGAIALTLYTKEKNNYQYIITLEHQYLARIIDVCTTMEHYIRYAPLPELTYSYTPTAIMIDHDLSVIDPTLTPTTPHHILLEAGTSFGTGQHPSTQLLLKWLHHNDLRGKTVCDVGCGSGILGVYAAMRGADHVYGVDIMETARHDTLHHAQLNNITLDVGVHIPDQMFDIIISNCERRVLEELQSQIIHALKPGGYWIITGVIGRVWKKLQHTLPPWPLHWQDTKGPWILAGLIKDPQL